MNTIRPAKNPGLVAAQAGIYKALVAAGLTVYDEPPENAGFPYITIGETVTLDAGTKTSQADEHVETLHVWSRKKGFSEAKQIASAAIMELSAYSFAESGYFIRFLELDSATSLRDPDGLTRHIVLRIRFKVNQA